MSVCLAEDDKIRGALSVADISKRGRVFRMTPEQMLENTTAYLKNVEKAKRGYVAVGPSL